MLSLKIFIKPKAVIYLCIFSLFFFRNGYAQKSGDFYFDRRGISQNVLENYLDRAVTMVYFLMPEKPEGKRLYPFHQDDVRLIQNIHPKFIGRSIYRWGGEALLNKDSFWDTAQKWVDTIHKFDREIIFQGCLFEIVTKEVDQVQIPNWVFKDFGIPVEERTFIYAKMLNKSGMYVDHWRKGSSVPDISRKETQMWFYYLAASYIKIGCEALHLGQVELIGMNDHDLEYWKFLIDKIRLFATRNARRNWVLLDAHVPNHGMIKNGESLIDFNSFPLRIKETPENFLEGKLEVGYLDALYTKSKGCYSPSGWKCEHLPYLVEFDNYGRGKTPNQADLTTHFVWGWDEISWFSLQKEPYRNKWLSYAYHWIKDTDSYGHLQMPINRMISCPNNSQGSYRANTKSGNCPIGYNQEETIKALWFNNNKQKK
ncbi:hypothetical protein [Galbibacter pacificus]|uniref:Uncharacterized protein n=1 Tax=Galbibacter pacificus TaxID=2996052 RepID=A0ABT6FMQ3_9FLAO|nr:hypothetical protein [Galbibacter pacificus]MDG3581065.1 hypothetical protein [Galbibacter pacificus]MDG3584543.1 hypothetical protein [Galbibacter pacificus]